MQQLEEATEQARQVGCTRWEGAPVGTVCATSSHCPAWSCRHNGCTALPAPLQANIAVAKAKRVLKELQAQVGCADIAFACFGVPHTSCQAPSCCYLQPPAEYHAVWL